MQRLLLGLLVFVALVGCGKEPAVTYQRDVRPILEQNCTSCHFEGGAGTYALTDYKSVKAHAAAIVDQTRTRRMPPTIADASGGCNTFQDAPWLSDADIQAIADWATEESPEGDAKTYVPRAVPTPLDIVPTHSLTMPDAYTPRAELEDDYRCFVLDPQLIDDEMLVAFRVRPGAGQLVHHVLLFALMSPEADAAVRAADDGEEGAGYTCYGGPDAGGNFNDFEMVAGWAPGTPTTRYPDGTGLRLQGGRSLVMQVHYHVHDAAAAAPDQSTIDLETTPCLGNYPGGCISPLEAYLAPTGVFNLNLAPGQSRVEVSDTTRAGDFVNFPLRVWAAFPHMHKRGIDLSIDVNGSKGDTCLVHVPRWDFNWQRFFIFDKPITVQPNDVITTRCAYDTTHDTTAVHWGESTDDEMCLNFFYVTP